MFNVPTVTIRHKRKGWRLVVNATDWAQDLGLVRWRDYERVNESHNDSGEVLVANTASKPEPAAPIMAPPDPEPAPTPRRATLSRRAKTTT